MNIQETCPDCGSDEVEMELGFRQYGSGRILLKLEVECDECGQSGIYQTGMDKL